MVALFFFVLSPNADTPEGTEPLDGWKILNATAEHERDACPRNRRKEYAE